MRDYDTYLVGWARWPHVLISGWKSDSRLLHRKATNISSLSFIFKPAYKILAGRKLAENSVYEILWIFINEERMNNHGWIAYWSQAPQRNNRIQWLIIMQVVYSPESPAGVPQPVMVFPMLILTQACMAIVSWVLMSLKISSNCFLTSELKGKGYSPLSLTLYGHPWMQAGLENTISPLASCLPTYYFQGRGIQLHCQNHLNKQGEPERDGHMAVFLIEVSSVTCFFFLPMLGLCCGIGLFSSCRSWRLRCS